VAVSDYSLLCRSHPIFEEYLERRVRALLEAMLNERGNFAYGDGHYYAFDIGRTGDRLFDTVNDFQN
jgi:prepilin-type processing-associated H-X9-DG protein